MLIFLFLSIVLSVFAEDQPMLRISNYGDYISLETLNKFSRIYNIHIIYDTQDTNETILKKLADGNKEGYDLVILSSPITESLIKQNMLEPLDKSKLPNFKNLSPEHINQYFDPNNKYSVPYYWGTIGIIYDSDRIKKITRWSDLWNRSLKNNVLISNEYADVFPMVLKSLGYSANSMKTNEIEQAYEQLNKLMLNAVMLKTGNTASQFVREGLMAGMVFSGDAVLITSKRHNYKYIYPEEGALKWMDNMLILKSSKNKDTAHKFINFILDAENSAELAKVIGYGLPNRAGYNLLSEKDKKNNIIYPDINMLKNSEIIKNTSPVDELKQKYWKMFKSAYDKFKSEL